MQSGRRGTSLECHFHMIEKGGRECEASRQASKRVDDTIKRNLQTHIVSHSYMQAFALKWRFERYDFHALFLTPNGRSFRGWYDLAGKRFCNGAASLHFNLIAAPPWYTLNRRYHLMEMFMVRSAASNCRTAVCVWLYGMFGWY